MRTARIIKLIGGLYTIQDLKTGELHDAVASGKLRHVKVNEISPFNVSVSSRTKKEPQNIKVSPKVGDIVRYDDSDDNNPIQEVFERKNELSRPDIANVDQILLMFSTVLPDMSYILLDRFLVIIEQANIKPIIVISKIDLMKKKELDKLKENLNYYKNIGYEVYYVNNLNDDTSVSLKNIYKDKVTAIAGQTGVGKSTFLNSLKPELNLKTQEPSKALGRGKHTTRHTELFLYEGGLIADTPGFSKLSFGKIKETDLKEYFIEFSNYSLHCRFKNKCYHINEPGCNIKDNENILNSRINNYQLFYNEIKDAKEIY